MGRLTVRGRREGGIGEGPRGRGSGRRGAGHAGDGRRYPGENFRKYSKAKSIERGVLIIINKAGV